MADTHSRIIAAAAKLSLASLGFQQKGRSRVWIADRGVWLNIVEFTPSRWSKSVSLTNAAHWLWTGASFMSYNKSVPSHCHAEFESEDQFHQAMSDITEVARINAIKLDEMFTSFEATADFLIERARSSPDRMGPSWWGYEAGIASGIVGRSDEADQFLRGVTDDRVKGQVAPLIPLIANPGAFRHKVNDLVAEERARLKLRPLASPAF